MTVRSVKTSRSMICGPCEIKNRAICPRLIDARVGDYVDFYAEMDLLLAASLCPRGSGATEPSEPAQERNPVTVQIFNSGMDPEPFSYESMRAMFTGP
jgi:hypothetical protein